MGSKRRKLSMMLKGKVVRTFYTTFICLELQLDNKFVEFKHAVLNTNIEFRS